MKRILSKIYDRWFPTLAVGAVVASGLVSDLSRAEDAGLTGPGIFSVITANVSEKQDTVIYVSDIYTKFRSEYEARAAGDTSAIDSLFADSLFADSTEVILTARDTMKVPDSLKYTDPFRYKYYVAIKDSLTHVLVRDSLKQAGDSVDWPRIDSLYLADSTETAIRKFNEWYASLDKAGKKKYDTEQKNKARQAMLDSLLNAKDSLLAIRDSIRENTPRILETFAVPDSMHYKRIFTWNKGRNFNEVTPRDIDTSYNWYFNDYPFFRENVNVSYLGISGSAVLPYDFASQRSGEGVSFYTPYESWTYSPYTLPMYNTKTPYTELAYWGTLFSNAERAENELHIMTTQNIFPSFNFTLEYDRFGGNGMLENENVDNRTFAASVNFLGKRYQMHAGYIYNKMSKGENGGIVDNFWIRDTTVGSREIAVRLKDASTLIKKNTVFLDQTYRIPFNFIKNLQQKLSARKEDAAYRDSVIATGDSLAISDIGNQLAERRQSRSAVDYGDSVDTPVTTAFIGHASEYSVYRKIYKDNIAASDTAARNLYDGHFYIHPTQTADSLRVMKLENKVFIRLRPWSDDGIVSALNVGVGDRLLSYYMFSPDSYIRKGGGNTVWNSMYLYGGARGQFKQYFHWDAEGYYTFLGDEINDVGLDASAGFNIYPFRRYRKSPMSFNARFSTTLDEPEYYQKHYYSNHYVWDNSFEKISRTEIEGSLSIPHWNLSLTAGYTLVKNHIYYNEHALPQQDKRALSIAKIELNKNFRFHGLHFDNRVLFQVSSDSDIIPLPMAALNARWYWQLNIVRNVMQMQIGANATYTSKWYAPGYSPALGTFFNQKVEEYGDCPYFDAFVNIQWKRACIFVKLLNAGMGWPMDSADYFSAHGYIRPQRAFKFGVFWPFYTQPAKNKGATSGGTAGGRSSGGSGAPPAGR